MALTHKQRLFVDEYLGRANGNATRAATLAGYAKPRQQGYENLTKPDIQDALRDFYTKRAMPAEEILGRLADQARGAGPYIRRTQATDSDEDATDGLPGLAFVDLAAMEADGKLHLIKRLKSGEFGQEIEFYDAQDALQLLGRNQRLFVDKADINVTGGFKVVSETTILDLRDDDDNHDAESGTPAADDGTTADGAEGGAGPLAS